MFRHTALVVTSIASPTSVLESLGEAARRNQWFFLVVGDQKSPRVFDLPGCSFFSIEAQLQSGYRFASECPVNHYARKNVGYLLASCKGADLIVESDDDNIPMEGFSADRHRRVAAETPEGGGWINIYRYFSDDPVWPRGLPLNETRKSPPPLTAAMVLDCPIQQGLCNGNPDVDAIYRLLFPLPAAFRSRAPVALRRGGWCPFNSQNTAWFRDAFPLMYLPAYCSFRMTDIWRSLIAQRICWEYGWSVVFHEATVTQQRNEHDLMRDFSDEVPGYLLNHRIAAILEALNLSGRTDAIADNMSRCYHALASHGIMDPREPALLELWLEDLNRKR